MQTFDGKPVASWIHVRLTWARRHGWSGRLVSGYRTNAEQRRLYDEWRRGERAGPVAKPGFSNHEGRRYPRGACDVTEPEELERVLQQLPTSSRPLVPFGPGDRPHFSATGR